MFKIGSFLNFVLAAGHLISLIWAKQVFEAGGIGEEMNQLSEIHVSLPYILTTLIAIGLFIIGLYGLSADGKIRKLPFLKLGIFTISIIYILRALMGVVEIFTTDVSVVLETSYSSGALILGLLYLIGGLRKWAVKNNDQSE